MQNGLKPKKTSLGESEIQHNIIQTLRALGFIVIRHNPISPLGDGKFKRLNVLDRGAPDLIALKNNLTFLFEVKTEKGKQSIYQKAFEKQCLNKGIKYHVVRSIEDVLNIIKICTIKESYANRKIIEVKHEKTNCQEKN